MKYFRYKAIQLRNSYQRSQNYTLILLTLAFIVGIIASVSLWATAALVLLLPAKFNTKKVVLIVVFFLFGFLYSNQFNQKLHYESEKLTNNKEVTGGVIEPPNSSGFSTELVIDDEELYGNIIAYIPLTESLKKGYKVTVTGELEKLETDSDYTTYLNSKKIFYKLKNGQISDYSKRNNLVTHLEDIRVKLVDYFKGELSSENAALISGILFGEKSSFSDEFKNNLKVSGTYHIVSASGFNVGIIYLIIMSLLKGKLHIKIALLLGAVSVVLYLLLIGIDILPALRATIMILIIILSQFLGLKNNIFISLSISTFIILLLYPFYIFNISLQLSLAASIGMFYFSPKLKNLLPKKYGYLRESMIGEIVFATLGTMLATFPVIIFTFGQISYVSFITNILILPFIPLITFIGIIAILASLISFNFITQQLSLLLESILNSIIFIINELGKFELFYIKDLRINLLFILVIVSIYYFNDFRNYKNAKSITNSNNNTAGL